MTIVFIALIALSVSIYIFGKIFSKNRSAKRSELPDNNSGTVRAVQPESGVNNQIPEEELIAVITAAIQASLDIRDAGKRVIVKSFRRLPASSSVWNAAGRMEQIGSKLV